MVVSALKWGILGAARVNERLLPAIIESPNAQLVAVASRRAGAAQATLEKFAPKHFADFKTVKCYDNLQALIDDANIEAIYCPMANEEHAQWALKAISAGKHILIEKPMTIRAAQVREIAAAAKANKVKAMEGFMYRFHPQHARINALVESGLIGDVLSARSSFGFLMKEARMYRINRAMSEGGGALWDIGPYAIHTLRWAFNMAQGALPKSVTAHAKLNEFGADLVLSGVLDFGRDALGRAKFGHFDISFEHSRKSEYELIGTKGWLKCHTTWAFAGDVPIISWATEAGESGEEQLPTANHFNLEIEHFSDCVLNDKAPLLSLQDALENAQTLEAVQRAALTKRQIAI